MKLGADSASDFDNTKWCDDCNSVLMWFIGEFRPSPWEGHCAVLMGNFWLIYFSNVELLWKENTLGINVWDSIQGVERVDISNENLVTGCLRFAKNLELLELKHFMSLRELYRGQKICSFFRPMILTDCVFFSQSILLVSH
jgi:hypothetical protein